MNGHTSRPTRRPLAFAVGLLTLALALTSCGSSESADSESHASSTDDSAQQALDTPAWLSVGNLAGTNGDGLILVSWGDMPGEESPESLPTTFSGHGNSAPVAYGLIDATGEAVQWDGEPDVSVESAMLTEPGLMVTGPETGGDALGGGGDVIALLDPADGDVMWSQPYGEGSSFSEECLPTGGAGELLLVMCEETAVFLDAETGEQRFQKALSGEGTAVGRVVALDPLIIEQYHMYDGPKSQKRVDVLDPATGEVTSSTEGVSWPNWEGGPRHASLDDPSYFRSGDNFIVTGYKDLTTKSENTISAIDADGEAVWSVDSDGELLAADDEAVLVRVDSTESLVVLDAATGEVDETIKASADSFAAESHEAAFVTPDVVALYNQMSNPGTVVAPVDQLGELQP